jgi:hypothetical protein
MGTPRYSYPLHLAPGLVASILFGGQRSFRQDAIACIRRLDPALQVFGAENIPPNGPFVTTVNHYYRPGFGAWWIAFAVASAIPVEMHWVMTGELTFPGKWYAFLGQPGSRWLLARAAKMYGFTTMPPMPPRERDVAARARSVRAVLEYVRSHPGAPLSVAPEGGDNPAGTLAGPPSGVGRFLLLLAGAGFSFLPVGCWEQEGTLCLRFGAAYRLEDPPGLDPHGRDCLAAGIVMQAISRQLPLHLRGEFK